MSCLNCRCFFFFKQKTAYEMRISDWSSDGCSSDLWARDNGEQGRLEIQKSYVDQLRGLDDGRFLQANFGNGVLGTWWAPTPMDDHLALVDASSVDKYAYTSPHVNDLFRDASAWPRATPTSSSCTTRPAGCSR